MGSPKRGVGIVTFPGSNGDHDALYAFQTNLGVPARLVDYRETDLDGFSAVVLPGGFSYGDYLRCGAIARFAPVIGPLREFADRGGPVLGICNGFQILTEAHLLPGALLRNRTLKFHCHWTHIRIETTQTSWTAGLSVGDVLRLPVAHGDGCYFADAETLDRLQAADRIVARYVSVAGEVTDEANANGSVRSIAAVANEAGNVVGLMPHPERASDGQVGGDDGLRLLAAVLAVVGAVA
jgi:phosphoribosylformylglycinamidine synthase